MCARRTRTSDVRINHYAPAPRQRRVIQIRMKERRQPLECHAHRGTLWNVGRHTDIRLASEKYKCSELSVRFTHKQNRVRNMRGHLWVSQWLLLFPYIFMEGTCNSPQASGLQTQRWRTFSSTQTTSRKRWTQEEINQISGIVGDKLASRTLIDWGENQHGPWGKALHETLMTVLDSIPLMFIHFSLGHTHIFLKFGRLSWTWVVH